MKNHIKQIVKDLREKNISFEDGMNLLESLKETKYFQLTYIFLKNGLKKKEVHLLKLNNSEEHPIGSILIELSSKLGEITPLSWGYITEESYKSLKSWLDTQEK